MRKYWELMRVGILYYFTYRLSFFMWRFRQLLLPLINLFLWLNVYSQRVMLFGYSQEQMLTYVILSTIVSSITLSSRTPEIAGDIISGAISTQLLRPLSFGKFVLCREIIDKGISIFFTILELILLIAIFHIPFLIPDNILSLDIFLIMLFISLLLTYFISLSISFIAFWSPEVWAPRFLYTSIGSMISGLLFPLDILPHGVYQLLMLTPFPYMIYVPVKLYLHAPTALANGEIWFFLAIGIVWCSIFIVLSQTLWKKGIKEFSFYGR